MEPVYLFDLASRHANWASVRQSVLTSNVANANTPGYKAKDIESFDDVMRKSVSMTVTDPQHLSSGIGTFRQAEDGSNDAEVLVSGNDVNLEQEFLKSNDVMRSYSMNTQIMRTFDRMLQSVTKA